MKLIVGLGNPGIKYHHNRHNIGFLLIDYLLNQQQITNSKKSFKALSTKTTLFDNDCIIIKPQTFMNLSGESVKKAADFYKISPKDILVIYDDIELNFGYIRLKKRGSAGTHNGMKSIIKETGTSDFPRLRLRHWPIAREMGN